MLCRVLPFFLYRIFVVLCSSLFFFVLGCCVLLCCVVLCCVVLCRVVSCRVVSCRVVSCRVVLCRRRCYQKAKGRDVYPRVKVNGLGCVCCVRAVRKCVGLGRGRGSRGDLVSSPLATALIPGAPAAPLPFLLAGAGAAPATPTPSCCPGPGGPSAVWHAPWRGRTRSVWTPPRRGGGTPCPASGAPYTPGGPAAWRGSAGLLPTAPAQSVPTAGDALGPPVAPPSGRATLRGAGGLAPTRAIEPSRPTGGAPSRAVSRTGGTLYPAPCPGGRNGGLGRPWTASLPGEVGSATPAMHCLTAWGQWGVELLQCTAALPGGSGQCNSCNALPHCLGAVDSATPAMHCLTAWGQWAVELLQYTAALPGGSGRCNSCRTLPDCLGAVGSATPATHCLTALGAVGSATPATHCLTA